MSLGFPKPPPANGFGMNNNGSSTAGTTTPIGCFVPPKPLPAIPPYGEYAVEVQNLTFSYNNSGSGSGNGSGTPVLNDLNLSLPTGSRCLLIGANGSGKSTLMRILAGRHLSSSSSSSSSTTTTMIKPSVKVLGLDAFHDTRLNFHRAYLDCDWGMRNVAFVGGNVPLMADIPVYKMMEKLQSNYPERRIELINMLGINMNWRMHQLSDGQRRRVQLFLGLLRPFQILLLDEVTTSLDVCVRQDLLRWLHKESMDRNATIIYATHIFDGLDDWSSHLYYLNNTGSCGWQGPMEQCTYYQQLVTTSAPASTAAATAPAPATVGGGGGVVVVPVPSGKMLAMAEHWLRKELEENRQRCIVERAQYGTDIAELYDPKSQGGYGSGRLHTITTNTSTSTNGRQGRLSDMMGNAGVMDKVHRSSS